MTTAAKNGRKMNELNFMNPLYLRRFLGLQLGLDALA